MNKLSSRRRRRGASMIEALVALVVLSFSALGYAALQIKGLSANSGALTRSKATQLAEEMADRIRANSASMAVYANSNYVGPQPDPGCANTGCSSAQMAALDISQWVQELSTALPGGTGVVCFDSSPTDGANASAPLCDGTVNAANPTVTVKVFWLDHGTPSAPVYVAVRP